MSIFVERFFLQFYINEVIINGVECISYDVEKDNILSLIYPVSDHMVLSVNCMPMDADENWEITRNIILSSIHPAE